MAVMSYDKLIGELIMDPSNIDTAVEAAFDRIDMRFLERLNERVQEDSPQAEILNPHHLAQSIIILPRHVMCS
jgi:hypothetical protein